MLDKFEVSPEDKKLVDETEDLEELDYSDPGSDEESIEDAKIEDSKEEDTNINEEDSGSEEEKENEETDENDGENDKIDTIEDDKEKKESTEPLYIEVNGEKIEVNSVEELATIASKALKSKKVLNTYKDDIAVLEGIKDQGLSKEDLYLLVEAKKGNKKAIAKLIKETGIDIFDLDPDDESIDEYKPNEYKADARIIETKAIIGDLKKDPNALNTFNNIINNDFTESERAKVFEDTNLLEFIGSTIKSGLFSKIQSSYEKRKLLGESSITALINAYDEFSKSEVKAKKERVTKTIKTKKEKAVKRKKVTDNTISKTKQKSSNKEPDFNNMTDEEFEAYYKNLVGDI